MPAPPLVSGIPLVGNLAELRRSQLRFFSRVRNEYGDIAMARVGNYRLVSVARPEWFQHVLQSNARNYDKQTRGFAALRLLLGNGLLTSEGEFWLRQRRLAQPVFGRRLIAGFAPAMARQAEALATTWAANAPEQVDAHRAMSELALGVVCETLLGPVSPADARDVGAALDEVLAYARWRTTVPDRLAPLAVRRNRRFNRAAQVLDRVVRRIIMQRRRRGEPVDAERQDLLDRFMGAVDPDTGARMDDAQLRDEVMTMLLAGHETTANALTWTLHLLSRHPEIQRQLREEVCALGDPTDPAQLMALGLTTRVLYEALRLYPPAWVVTRHAIGPDRIGEWDIPADAMVIASPWVLHRNPRYWPEPERFRPDRFLPEAVAERHRFAWLPFGGGPRLCIGRDFAIQEALIGLVILLRRFRVLPTRRHVEPLATITLKPNGGLPLLVEPLP